MEESHNLNLPFIMPSQAQKHVSFNEALRGLDALVQLAVLDRDLAGPPVLPSEGDRFIVAAGASGAWAGAAGRVAAFQDGAWLFYQPRSGWLAWVSDEETLVVWTGAAWEPLPLAFSILRMLHRFGLGTAADAANPFAAKLNAALWTALTAAEGGNGDLSITANKEGAADAVSLLFQAGFSGRAEIGLLGDDDLAVKVSANGTSWLEALKVDRTSGRLGIAGQIRFPAAQNASSDLNTLDDYREGSTTPAPTSGISTLTSASATLDYQKVGRWVTFQAAITVTTAGSGTGSLNIPLPFAAASAASANGIEAALTGATVSGLINGSTLSCYRFDGNSIIGSGRTVRIAGRYPAAS